MSYTPKINVIFYYDLNFKKTKESIEKYFSDRNIKIYGHEVKENEDINYFFEKLFLNIYSQLISSDAEYIISIAPYVKINKFDFDIFNLINKDFEFHFFNEFNQVFDFSFFVIKNTKNTQKIVKKILYLEKNILHPSKDVKSYNNTFDLFNKEVVKTVKEGASIFFFEKNINYKMFIYKFIANKNLYFMESYFDFILNTESKYVALEIEDLEDNIEEPMLQKHYSDDLCIISLYTKEIEDQGKISAKSIQNYCDKHKISYHIYTKPPLSEASGNWSKSILISSKLKEYSTVMWLDADIVITNKDYNIRNLLSSFNQEIILCKDISKGHLFNSGAMIFKNSKFSNFILEQITLHILSIDNKTSVHVNGGDQSIFGAYLNEYGREDVDYVILPEKTFNSHPINWTDGDVIMHLMGYGGPFRTKYMRYLYQKFLNN